MTGSAPRWLDMTGPRWPLSNFSDHAAWCGGERYPSGEAAYQAAKFLDRSHREAIRRAPTPMEARILGRSRRHRIRDGWDAGVAVVAMAEVLVSKARESAEVRSALVATGDAVLVELNDHHDQRWGDCTCGGQGCRERGANQLGVLWMGVRASIR